MADDETMYEIAKANRLLAADMFEGLTDEQWRTPSLCAGWTVREIAAHLLAPLETTFSVPSLVWKLIRYRGSLERMVDEETRAAAVRPVAELVAGLREHAGARFSPPVTGAAGPMADTAIHLRDAARPLGLEVNPPVESWRPVLDFLVSKPAARGFVPAKRIAGLRFVVTDQDWSHGAGPEVHGTSEAVAMAVAGRDAALADLTGPGLDELRSRSVPG